MKIIQIPNSVHVDYSWLLAQGYAQGKTRDILYAFEEKSANHFRASEIQRALSLGELGEFNFIVVKR